MNYQIRYGGQNMVRLTDLFKKEAINRADGKALYNDDYRSVNEYFINRLVRSLNNESLNNTTAVIDTAFMIFPRLKISDLKDGVLYKRHQSDNND